MVLLSFLPSTPNTSQSHKNKKKQKIPPAPPRREGGKASSSSWEQFKSLLSCRDTTNTTAPSVGRTSNRKYAKLSSTFGSSMCAIRGAVRGNTRVTDHGSSPDGGSRSETAPLSARSGRIARAPPPSRGGMQLMKLSGCYECRAVDVHSVSRRYPRPRALCPCTECGERFTKPESLEQHQATRHAVSELGSDDSGRNIVEIIFKSSWQRRNGATRNPTVCSVERILKVHNTPRTVSRFEDHRAAVISRCAASAADVRRCAADGNELLRFHSAPVSCPLGTGGSTSLCLPRNHDPAARRAPPPCGVCAIIRHGFSEAEGPGRVRTTASSGGAHEGSGRRAMLVCRVIAGRVKRKGGDDGDDEMEGSSMLYDSVAGDEGDVEELFVDNPGAILPCFVVIYKA